MIFAVIGTKGGSGKSTISTQVLPLVLGEIGEVEIIEIDNNNVTKLKNSKLKIKNFKVVGGEIEVDKISYIEIKNPNKITIIDGGGGDDSLKILHYFKNINLTGIKYLIPINDDIEQIENLKNTISEIKKVEENPKIFVVLNQCTILEKEAIREQFIGVFGSKKYGFREEKFENEISFLFLQKTHVFGILKNWYGLSIVDSLAGAIDLIENYGKYRIAWVTEGTDDEYIQKLNYYKFAKDLVELADSIKISFSEIGEV